jgi:hypothetical protein
MKVCKPAISACVSLYVTSLNQAISHDDRERLTNSVINLLLSVGQIWNCKKIKKGQGLH